VRTLIGVVLVAVAAGVTIGAQTPHTLPAQAIPDGAERAYQAIKDRVDGGAAMEIVRFMDQFWRVSGNPGFNASVDRIRDGLQAAGVANRVEEFNSRGRGWDYQAGTLSFADTGEVLLSRERDRV
jgi:hypothetical protein